MFTISTNPLKKLTNRTRERGYFIAKKCNNALNGAGCGLPDAYSKNFIFLDQKPFSENHCKIDAALCPVDLPNGCGHISMKWPIK